MKKMLIITNTHEVSSSMVRYLNYTMHKNSLYPCTFDDLRIISREILEMDFIITEAYRFEGNSIDNYGLDMFLSFVKNGKKGMLLYVDGVQSSEFQVQELLVKLPWEVGKLKEKLENIEKKKNINLKERDIEILKEMFPFPVKKGHHHSQERR